MEFPDKLPEKFVTEFNPEQQLLVDLFEGCVPFRYLLPQRPWEDAPAYEYRCKSVAKSFPLRSAVSQAVAALQTQELTAQPVPELPAAEQEQALNVVGLEWAADVAPDLAKALLIHGKAWALATADSETLEPQVKVIDPGQVMACGKGLLVWREFEVNVLNPETFKSESNCNVFILAGNLLAQYRTPVKRVKVPLLLTGGSEYKPAETWQLVDPKKRPLALVEGPQEIPPDSLVQLRVPSSVGLDCVDLILNYLRTTAAIVDIANSSGYVQRVLTPETQGSLDLPIDLEDVETSNNHLIKAQSFTFAEMEGTSIAALMAVQSQFAEEQLRELGLDLTATAAASGDAREIDASRLKSLVDQLGRTITAGLNQLAEVYVRAEGLRPGSLVLGGLNNYSPRTTTAAIQVAQSKANLLKTCPYPAKLEVWAELLGSVPGIQADGLLPALETTPSPDRPSEVENA